MLVQEREFKASRAVVCRLPRLRTPHAHLTDPYLVGTRGPLPVLASWSRHDEVRSAWTPPRESCPFEWDLDRHPRLVFGSDVELIAISRDPADTLAAWARDASFPFRLASDVDGVAGRAYGALAEGRQWESRHLYVIDASGRISAVMRPFREIDPTAYDELKAAVAAARSATR